MNIKKQDKQENDSSLILLYELLLQSASIYLSMFVTINKKTYSTSSIPEDVLSAKLKLDEIKELNLENSNILESKEYKKDIENGFKTFLKNDSQNIYTKIYFSENIKNKILSSDKFIKILYNFLENSKLTKTNPIIYINNIKISKKDLKKSIPEFTKHLNTKLDGLDNENINYSKIEITKTNTLKNSIFKRLDVLSNLINIA